MSNPALFTLECIGSDNSVLVNLNIQDVSVSDILSATIFSNDSNADNASGSPPTYRYNEANNAFWTSYSLTPTEIKSQCARYTGLTNGKSYIFKAMIRYKTTGSNTVSSLWSTQTPDIALIPKPAALTLIDDLVVGKISDESNNYNIKVSFPANFFENATIPDKITFLRYNNELDATDVLKVSEQDFAVPSNASVNIFKLTTLSPDNTYEVSCISVKGYQTSISNTISITPSSKPSAPYKAKAKFDYLTGGVKLITEIKSDGVGSGNSGSEFTYSLQVYENGIVTPTPSFTISNLSIDYNIFDPTIGPQPFTLDTTTYKNTPYEFFLGRSYTVRFLATNSSGTSNEVADRFFTFVPIKKAEPVVNLSVKEISVGNGKIKFEWEKPELYGVALSKYILTLTNNADSADVRIYDVDPALYADQTGKVTYTTIIDGSHPILANGIKYNASVVTVTVNSVNYSNTYKVVAGSIVHIDDANVPVPALLDGKPSTDDIYATPYRKMSAPSLAVSYDEADVDSKAMFTISDIDQSSGISFSELEICYLDSEGSFSSVAQVVSLIEAQSAVPVTGLANGTLYKFGVRGICNVSTSVSTLSLRVSVEGNMSSSKTLLPWRKPYSDKRPVISINAQGNHFVTVNVTAADLAGTGLTASDLLHYICDPDTTLLSDSFTSTRKTFYGLENRPVESPYSFPINAYYKDPNRYISNNIKIRVTGITVTGRPRYTDGPYQPQTVSAAADSSGSVTVNWSQPLFGGAEGYSVDDQMYSPLGYRIYRLVDGNSPYLLASVSASTYQSVISYNSANPKLALGSVYTIRVEAHYQDSYLADGEEVAYNDSDTVTPYTPADAPTINTIVPGNKKLTVSYTAPSNTGGLTIVGYRFYKKIGSLVQPYYEYLGTTSPHELISLVNGTSYNVAMTTLTRIPSTEANSGDLIEGNMSDYFSARTPVPDSIANISNFRVSSNGTDLSNNEKGSITLSWTALSDPDGDLARLGYIYQIQQVTSGDSPTPIGLPIEVQSNGSSKIISELTLGVRVHYRIRIRVTDTDAVARGDSDPYKYGLYTQTDVSTVPYDSTPSAVQGVAATGGDASATVTWTAESVIGGAPVAGYNVYYKLDTEPSSAYAPANLTGPVTTNSLPISGLTNGLIYSFYVAYKLFNSVNNDTSAGEEQPYGPGNQIEVTAIPFKAPTKPTIRVENKVDSNGNAVSKTVVIKMVTSSTDGGSEIIDYSVYQDGERLTRTWSGLGDYEVTDLNDGQSYNFTAAARYGDLNLNRNDVNYIKYGPKSDPAVSIIPYGYNTSSPVIEHIENVSETSVRVYYSFIPTPNIGLSDQVLYLTVNGSDRQVSISDSPVLVDGFIAGTELALSMYSTFAEPNLNARVEGATSDNEYYTAYGTPEIDGFEKGTIGNTKAQVKLYSEGLTLHNGRFLRYEVTVFDANNNQVGYVYNVSEPRINLTITGLQNNATYSAKAIAFTTGKKSSLDELHPNIEAQSAAAWAYEIIPRENKLPEIKTVDCSHSHPTYIEVEVQSYYEDLTGFMLFVSPVVDADHPYYLQPNVELYYECGTITASPSHTAVDGVIKFRINLIGIETTAVNSIAAIALNNDGKSATKFVNVKPDNYLAGGSVQLSLSEPTFPPAQYETAQVPPMQVPAAQP